MDESSWYGFDGNDLWVMAHEDCARTLPERIKALEAKTEFLKRLEKLYQRQKQ